ncbi:MAG: hypothetical protein V9E93_00470 [Steroidobacteraceae bacterium]
MTIATSAPASAMPPISGRLPGSRSPPQPNTQSKPAARVSAGRVEHLCERVR